MVLCADVPGSEFAAECAAEDLPYEFVCAGPVGGAELPDELSDGAGALLVRWPWG